MPRPASSTYSGYGSLEEEAGDELMEKWVAYDVVKSREVPQLRSSQLEKKNAGGREKRKEDNKSGQVEDIASAAPISTSRSRREDTGSFLSSSDPDSYDPKSSRKDDERGKTKEENPPVVPPQRSHVVKCSEDEDKSEYKNLVKHPEGLVEESEERSVRSEDKESEEEFHDRSALPPKSHLEALPPSAHEERKHGDEATLGVTSSSSSSSSSLLGKDNNVHITRDDSRASDSKGTEYSELGGGQDKDPMEETRSEVDERERKLKLMRTCDVRLCAEDTDEAQEAEVASACTSSRQSSIQTRESKENQQLARADIISPPLKKKSRKENTTKRSKRKEVNTNKKHGNAGSSQSSSSYTEGDSESLLSDARPPTEPPFEYPAFAAETYRKLSTARQCLESFLLKYKKKSKVSKKRQEQLFSFGARKHQKNGTVAHELNEGDDGSSTGARDQGKEGRESGEKVYVSELMDKQCQTKSSFLQAQCKRVLGSNSFSRGSVFTHQRPPGFIPYNESFRPSGMTNLTPLAHQSKNEKMTSLCSTTAPRDSSHRLSFPSTSFSNAHIINAKPGGRPSSHALWTEEFEQPCCWIHEKTTKWRSEPCRYLSRNSLFSGYVLEKELFVRQTGMVPYYDPENNEVGKDLFSQLDIHNVEQVDLSERNKKKKKKSLGSSKSFTSIVQSDQCKDMSRITLREIGDDLSPRNKDDKDGDEDPKNDDNGDEGVGYGPDRKNNDDDKDDKLATPVSEHTENSRDTSITSNTLEEEKHGDTPEGEAEEFQVGEIVASEEEEEEELEDSPDPSASDPIDFAKFYEERRIDDGGLQQP